MRSPHPKGQISGQYSSHRHIEYVGPQRKHSTILKNKRLNRDDGSHHDSGRGRRPV